MATAPITRSLRGRKCEFTGAWYAVVGCRRMRTMRLILKCWAAFAFVSAVSLGFLPRISFAASGRFVENQTAEEKYWKKAHEKEARKAAGEERQEANRRDTVKATLPEVIREGEAIQGQIFAAEEALKPPVQTSIFQGKGEYIVF